MVTSTNQASMGRHSKRDSSHICKFLTDEDEYTSFMQIPSQLVKSHGESLPSEVTLKIDESGGSWKVGIEKFKGHYFFTDGWEKFAKDIDIGSREYLQFKASSPLLHQNPSSSAVDYVGDSDTADTFVDEEKGSEIGDYVSGDGDSEDTFADEDNGSGVGSWTFSKELTKNNSHRLNIPKYFARGSGISGCGKIKVLDEKGRKWLVCLTEGGGDFTMGSGWHNFLVANEVVVGSTLSFKYISSSDYTIEAQVIKKGTNENELFEFVKMKKRGRSEFADPSHKTHNDRPGGENGSNAGGNWKFTKEIKKYHAYTLDIPNEFARGTGIAKITKMKLVDAKGRKWEVNVKLRSCGVYSITSGGWNDFLVGNKVRVGSTILFEWVPDSSNDLLVEAKVLDDGRKGNGVFVKRKYSKVS